MRRRSFTGWFLVPIASLALIATACSAPASSTKANTVVPETNTGLCRLVAPSVVATAISVSMMLPTTLTRGPTTECVYRSKSGASTAVLLRYDTDTSGSTFIRNKTTFERRGQHLGPITGLGDQAYYFSEQTGQATVTTVVLLWKSLQLLTTGTATLDQIGSIARYALNQYESTHSRRSSTSS